MPWVPSTTAEISTADKYRCALPSWPPRYLGAPDAALPRVSSGSRCYKSGCPLLGSISQLGQRQTPPHAPGPLNDCVKQSPRPHPQRMGEK